MYQANNWSELSSMDEDILDDKYAWLNDNLNNFGQSLLKKKFPTIGGLNDVSLQHTLCFVPEDMDKPFVQILNTSGQHWICVTNRMCQDRNTVRIYDSLRTGDIAISTKECIAALINCQTQYIYLLYPDVEQQKDGSSCGLYALAFAYSLCNGEDPSV